VSTLTEGGRYGAFAWRDPDYLPVIKSRMDILKKLRTDREQWLPPLKVYYRDHIADFINDWGYTFDPRNVERGIPALIPFVLFPKQREWVDWLIDHWHDQKPGLVEKSREVGVSWLMIATACSLCLLYDGVAIGFGSRKAEYVDHIGLPKALLPKARIFLANLPVEFRAGWVEARDAPYMRISFPETGSLISGEAGDNIGRGDRTSIYFVDEAAHIDHPNLIEASLASTTNCRVDVSSVNGMTNAFAQKRHSGLIDVFTLHWRDDPRKDQAWYDKICSELDPVTVAQEIDINYSASVEGLLIPSTWVQAAVDAHIKLKFEPTGATTAALDVADEGVDKNAMCVGKGVLITRAEEWSGKGDDIYGTVLRAFSICDEEGSDGFSYDADGLGAGVRGDARVVNERRGGRKTLTVTPFRGSGEVRDPKRQDVPGRANEDFFANAKAQGWWSLRTRFQKTFRAVTEGVVAQHDELISISSRVANLPKLLVELSQPRYRLNSAGKVLVDKAPEGAKSPNQADAVMIRFANLGSGKPAFIVTSDTLAKIRASHGRGAYSSLMENRP
jgi:phage terminase large subunit